MSGALLLSIGGAALADKGKPPHHGKGREKVTLCHNGHTITVGRPAVPAHLHHGDTLGPCHPAVPGVARLTVIKHVVNDNGGTKTAADFTLTINGVTAVGGNTFVGSASGVTKTLTTVGSYTVVEAPAPGYTQTASADCSGTIASGESKTCTITNDDIAAHTARLTVVKHVINDNGGTKAAADFTLTIHGVTAVGGNTFAGSATGVTKTLTTVGSYTVVEAPLPGYAQTASADCSGTIASGESKTCTITNDDIAARITVVKQVISNDGGTRTPADFTLTINGVTAVGGNTFAGSAAGVTKTLATVGGYTVTEAAVPGYALKSASADCSGTIALGQHKTCVLVNDDHA